MILQHVYLKLELLLLMLIFNMKVWIKLCIYICLVDKIFAIEGSKIKYTSYVG